MAKFHCKYRFVLMQAEQSTMKYYMGEYSSERRISIDALVTALIELLNTSVKVSTSIMLVLATH